MNPIAKNLKTGTIDELLVQLRLLQFDVQAAPPLKDTGNDLIAVKGEAMSAIQVKTTAAKRFDVRGLPKLYDALALVHLFGEDNSLYLDKCDVFLLARENATKRYYGLDELGEHQLRQDLIDNLFLP